MTTALLITTLVLLALVVVLQIRLLTRKTVIDLTAIQQSFESVEKSQERAERLMRDDIAKSREESAGAARQSREELAGALKATGDTLNQQIGSLTTNTDQKLERVRETMEQKLDTLKLAVDERLKAIQSDNTKQLDQMRATVDEKLQGILEKRLGESFKLVSDRLEQVYKGLGEMQTLAIGVGDLKKVLTHVKTRGTWGEIQLGAMLEQILSPDQYATNVATKDGGERVEFAIKLPGRSDDKSEVVWLPIDAKFPLEDYQRLVEAQEKAASEAAEEAAKQLEIRVKQCAQDICDKYIGPPRTTDFGILYLPTEGLFAEVIRRIGLPEAIQRDCRVVIAGPTTLWSILNSLQMGFRTLAIEKRSSEVWKVLGAVKTEFGRFGELLDGVKRKLDQASNTIDDAARKSRPPPFFAAENLRLKSENRHTILSRQPPSIPNSIPASYARFRGKWKGCPRDVVLAVAKTWVASPGNRGPQALVAILQARPPPPKAGVWGCHSSQLPRESSASFGCIASPGEGKAQ